MCMHQEPHLHESYNLDSSPVWTPPTPIVTRIDSTHIHRWIGTWFATGSELNPGYNSHVNAAKDKDNVVYCIAIACCDYVNLR